jgi:predicted amidohydrolase YtcJ
MKRAWTLAFALGISSFCFAAMAAAPSMVLVNGKVYTGSVEHPFAQAVAITGNQISAVGTTDAVRALASPDTQVIDLQGKLVIPGINDAHTHPLWNAPGFPIEAENNATWKQVAALIASVVDETPADIWIQVTVGGPVISDPAITRATLDSVAPGRKVALHAFTGHGMVLSTAALADLGVPLTAPDPVGGTFGRDQSGQLNGRAFEYAQYPLERQLADLFTDEEMAGAFSNFSDEAIRFGITSIQAMAGPTEARFVNALHASSTPLRVRVMTIPAVAAPLPKLSKDGDALKWILDGTPIESGAALRRPYVTGGVGRENFQDPTKLVQLAIASKRQVLLHAVGDKTIETALKVLKANPSNRPRIEHGDGILRDLVDAVKATGAIVVQNPSHFPFAGFYPLRAYMPFRSLLEAGIPIAIGSDGPLNPYLNILLATERQDKPEESLTRDQALRAYTSGSAFAEMKETQKGKIAAGMLADLAVLTQDIFVIPANALPDTRSALTIIGGKIVFQAPQ